SQSTRARRIRRPWRDAVLQRRRRTRTRDRERRQQAGARGDGRTRLDLVALAAGQRLVRVVPRARRRNGRRADQENHDRRLVWRYVTDGVPPDGAIVKVAAA